MRAVAQQAYIRQMITAHVRVYRMCNYPLMTLAACHSQCVRYPKPPNSINSTILFTYFIVTHRNAL